MYSLMDGLIPITIVAIIFTTVSAVGIALIFASIKKRKMEVDAYKAAIEKGLPVPELKSVSSPKTPTQTLKAALVWLAVGTGFGIMMLFVSLEDRDFTPLGLSTIPILVGVALVISYVVEKKEREKEKSES